MCVTKAISPFGKLTWVFKIVVIEVKQVTECTIWSVAPVSMTQSVVWKNSLSTFLAENIECCKVGLKERLEEVPDMVSMKLELLWTDVEGTPWASVIKPETLPLVLTDATWWFWPWLIPGLKRARSCSHCALVIGQWSDAFEGLSTVAPYGKETWLALNFPFCL